MHPEMFSPIVIPDLRKIQGIQQCATYNPPGPTKPGIENFVCMFVLYSTFGVIIIYNFKQLQIRLSKVKIKEWIVFIHHHENLVIQSLSRIYGNEILSFDIHRLPANSYQYEISPTETTFINQEDNPCISATELGKERVYQCLESYKYSLLNCTLPWRYKKSDRQLPLCSHPREYDIYTSIASLASESFDQDFEGPYKIEHVAKCSPTCTRYAYTTKLFQQEQWELENSFILRFYYNQHDVPVREHVYAYDEWNLVSDFGGWLGLLLGYSILGFYDKFEFLVGILREKLTQKRQSKTF